MTDLNNSILEPRKTKKKSNYQAWVLICCVITFIGGRFVPVYFTNTDFKNRYYLTIIMLLSLLIGVVYYCKFFKPGENNVMVTIWSFILGMLLCFGMMFVYIFLGMSDWKVAATYYINKGNPEIKITRRYWDQGALGGGSKPEDYHLLIERPITPWFRLETSTDTSSLKKEEWIKVAIKKDNWTEMIK